MLQVCNSFLSLRLMPKITKNFNRDLPKLTSGSAYSLVGWESRYFLTISATLKVTAWSNSRRSRPVSFLIFSSLYTRVFLCTKSFLEVSETLRLFSKKLCTVISVSRSSDSSEPFLNTSERNISQRVVGSW